MDEKLFEALDEAVGQEQAVTQAVDAQALLDQLAKLEARIAAGNEELAKLKQENAQLTKTAKIRGNAHLAAKTEAELFDGVKGLPVQVVIRYGLPGQEKEVIAQCEQTTMSSYGTKNEVPGMSLQSSNVIMDIADWGETRFLLQGKLILQDRGRQ